MIYELIWIMVICAAVTEQFLPEGSTNRMTVCVGDTLRASCPSKENIAVKDIQFGVKLSSTCGLLAESQECCQYDASDCLTPYIGTIQQQACSGKDLCHDVNIAQEITSCNTSYPVLNHYLTMEYYCISVSRIVQGYSASKTSTAKLLYLQNTDYPLSVRNTALSAVCSVETKNCFSKIKTYFLDVDLFKDEYGTCMQHIQIDDKNVTKTFTCLDNNYYKIAVRDLSSSNYITLRFMNPGRISEGKFWIGFQDTEESAILSLNCPAIAQTMCMDCGDIIVPKWGRLAYTNGTSYLSVAIYRCNIGYTLVGEAIRTCQADGTWSFPLPSCRIIESNGSKLSVIAGVVPPCLSACLVVAFAIICYWKRRGKVCFYKDTEESNSINSTLDLREIECFRPTGVKLDRFPSYVAKLHDNDDFLFKDGFKLLQNSSVKYPTKASETDMCKKKSRYSNLLPFDHSRVTLLPIDDEEGSDFINACHIPGYTSRWEYIATQDPVAETQNDFWRMIWEYQVAVIVKLTDKDVEDKERLTICSRYWPDNMEEYLQFGEMKAKLLSESEQSNCTVRTIEIQQKTESRVVNHIAIKQWPEEKLTGGSNILLALIEIVRENTNLNETRPIVVHCDDGVGRTGVFIAVDRLIQHVRDHDVIDIYSAILDIRKYRQWMVKFESQFIFVYECMRDFLNERERVYEKLSTETDGQNAYSTIGMQSEELDLQIKNPTHCRPYDNLRINVNA